MSETNIVNILKLQRSARERQRQDLEALALDLMVETGCDIPHLYGASPADIARASVIIAELPAEFGLDYQDELRSHLHENLAQYISLVTADALKRQHTREQPFEYWFEQDACLCKARRMLSEPKYSRMFGPLWY